MNAYRIKPSFVKEGALDRQSPPGDSMGCVLSAAFVAAAYFILSAALRVTSGAGSRLDGLLCYASLAGALVLLIWGARDLHHDSQEAAAERQQWKAGCIPAEARVTGRHGGTWQDGYEKFHTAFWLELEMTPGQQAASPGHTVVSVEVSQGVYERLARRDTVRIYSRPEVPLTFLLEEEI